MAVVIHFDGRVDPQQQRDLLRASVAALDGEHYILLWPNEIFYAGEIESFFAGQLECSHAVVALEL